MKQYRLTKHAITDDINILKNLAHLGCYAAQIGTWLLTFWNNMSVPFSRVKQSVYSGKLPQAAMLITCVQMSVLDLGSETDYPEPRFTLFYNAFKHFSSTSIRQPQKYPFGPNASRPLDDALGPII
jgi:hypothetical protein